MAFYSKETLNAEFSVAKDKDQKGKKEKYDNRIQFFKDHIELRNNHPEYYEGIDINFSNLLAAYQSDSPIDHFYMTGFGKTYAEKMAESEIEKSEKASVK